MLLCINTIHQTLVNIYNFYINFAGLDSPCFVSQDSNCSLQTHKGGQVLSKSETIYSVSDVSYNMIVRYENSNCMWHGDHLNVQRILAEEMYNYRF